MEQKRENCKNMQILQILAGYFEYFIKRNFSQNTILQKLALGIKKRYSDFFLNR